MPASASGSEHRNGAIRVDSPADGIIAVCLDGDFDLVNAPVLRTHVDGALASGKDLIVDLSDATFIDSSVISILFQAAKLVDGRDRTVILQLDTAPIVERVLELVGVEDVLPRAHSRTEAVERIRRRGESA